MRIRLLPPALFLLLLALVPAAHADGLPVLGVDVGASGVAGPALQGPRYVTLRAGPDTLVAKIDRDGGAVLRSRLLERRLTVPAVAYDGSAAGLSTDGGTLVLIRPRVTFPRKSTEFAVLDAKTLRVRERVTLDGDFSFDALSPDGKLLYLIEYPDPLDPTVYLVRLYDIGAGSLVAKPVIDPREVGDVMQGTPLTRASSPDSRWAYTLYDGGGEIPFIHALDTVERKARCIDLDGLQGLPLEDTAIGVSPDGRTLTLVHPSYERPFAIVDTETFEVTRPARAAEAPRADDGSGTRVALAGGVLLALLLVLGAGRLLRRVLRPREPLHPT